MKILSHTLTALFLSLLSLNALATSYKYTADVEGMVCAFCAYSVSKNISKIPGVNNDSIDVDLKGGHVVFTSKQTVSEKKLTELFSDSGFSLSNITSTKITPPTNPATSSIILDLKIDSFKADQFSQLIETLGNTVANRQASLLIRAPASQEETILKPLLMGRQQVVKVRFEATASDTIQILLYDN